MTSSLGDLLNYLTALVGQKALTEGSSRSYKTSVVRVFRDATDREREDVLSADLDDLIERFRKSATAEGFEYVTIGSYEGRVKAALRKFEKARRPGSGGPSPADYAEIDAVRVPIRPGVTVEIFGLPVDLTDKEAQRISAFVSGMVA